MMHALQEANLAKLFEEMVVVHPKITIQELNTVYKQFENAAIKKYDTADIHLLRTSLIEFPQFQKLIYHFIPHLLKQSEHVDSILMLFFKRGDRKDKQVMNFEEFISILELLWRGSLFDHFTAYFFLFFTKEDSIAQENFKYLINLLYRFTFTGDTSEDEFWYRLDILVDVIFNSLRGPHDSYTYDELIEMFKGSDFLVSFWQQLYRD